MNTIIYLRLEMRTFIIIVFLCFTATLSSQQKKFSKTQSLSIEAIDLTQGEDAILQVEQILNRAKQAKDLTTQGKCYDALAIIYEGIEEYELAIDRRQTALQFFQQANDAYQSELQIAKIGQLYLELKNWSKAASFFRICIERTGNASLDLICKEGLADAYAGQGKEEESLNYYDALDSSYQDQNSTLSNARINAKKAKVYASQNDQYQARENYRRAAEGYGAEPKETTDEDLKDLEEAKEVIIKQEPEAELDLRYENVERQMDIPAAKSNVLKENVEISKKLVEAGDMVEAESIIAKTKSEISSTTERLAAKDVYKVSSDINFKKGNYELALKDLEDYETLSRQSVEQKIKEQNRLINILKAQRRVDLNEKDLTISLNQAEYRVNQLQSKNWIIGLLSLLLLGALLAFYFIYKNIQAKRQANQLLLLKSLRAQMNPHFIFNVLNSVNSFIAKNDERAANKYLADFSKLMRKVLQDSQKDFITLEEEMDLMTIYLRLEHLRFEDKFDYTITVDDAVDIHNVSIPPMLIQPFVENAIWHGLRYKESKGNITLSVNTENGTTITISDNGIGRAKSKELKTKNQKSYTSTGMKNLEERLRLINTIYGKSYRIDINDLSADAEDVGTQVIITLTHD